MVIMARKPGEGNYSDDEIEQILGMEAPEVKFALKEIRKTIKEDPLLVAGLVSGSSDQTDHPIQPLCSYPQKPNAIFGGQLGEGQRIRRNESNRRGFQGS
jgi:hypothetical protein